MGRTAGVVRWKGQVVVTGGYGEVEREGEQCLFARFYLFKRLGRELGQGRSGLGAWLCLLLVLALGL